MKLSDPQLKQAYDSLSVEEKRAVSDLLRHVPGADRGRRGIGGETESRSAGGVIRGNWMVNVADDNLRECIQRLSGAEWQAVAAHVFSRRRTRRSWRLIREIRHKLKWLARAGKR